MKKVIFFGQKGSYSEKAMFEAQKICDFLDYEIESSSYIDEIIQEVGNSPDSVGILPVENSIEGIVRETVDKLIQADNSVKIFQEIVLPISHCLINKTGKIEDVKVVLSHPQALAQCSGYIKNLGNKYGYIVKKQTSVSTSEAVRLLDNYDDSYAAIANSEAANIYNKKIVDIGINDEADNKTRFICIGKKTTQKTGNDKTSFAFTTQNKSGALLDVLDILRQNKINMSHIDSRPSKKVLGEYIFCVDIDGHIDDICIKSSLEEIKKRVNYYRFFGSYSIKDIAG
ncbi:MAG: prephenate dehydratase [bacterium]|nr:prephenate dehydratase [bacterium]